MILVDYIKLDKVDTLRLLLPLLHVVAVVEAVADREDDYIDSAVVLVRSGTVVEEPDIDHSLHQSPELLIFVGNLVAFVIDY